MGFRRWAQAVSLVLFLILLTAASFGWLTAAPLDIFLNMDPALAAISIIGSRSFQWAFLPALMVLLSGMVLGRAFCGYICPMGASLDVGEKLASDSPGKKTGSAEPRSIKYLVLAFFLGAALFGVSFVFLASPLSLITRFYGTVIWPAAAFLAEGTVNVLRPLAERFNWQALMFAQIDVPRFAAQYFVLAFFVVVFVLGRYAPRFWCRYLCPAGALLGLCSIRPMVRRRVTDDCVDCGRCARSCPMGAIDRDDARLTRYSECFLCRECEKVCPVGAIVFDSRTPPAVAADRGLPSRRQFLTFGLTGAGTAVVGLTGLTSLAGKSGEGQVAPPLLLRPPGSRPEMDFLTRCVRCGECLAACPTNTLQPVWFKSGPLGIFTPAVTPRRGFCDPRCNRCGQVCPTQAIRPLVKKDRIWAKTGTAVVFRQKCLAWEFDKSCLVCDEVCPFDAIEFKPEPGLKVAVPHVNEYKCAGCGYCEHYCPVQNQPAILVSPMGEIRLAQGGYEEEAKSRGLNLQLRPGDYTAPSVEGGESAGPAPGFTD